MRKCLATESAGLDMAEAEAATRDVAREVGQALAERAAAGAISAVWLQPSGRAARRRVERLMARVRPDMETVFDEMCSKTDPHGVAYDPVDLQVGITMAVGACGVVKGGVPTLDQLTRQSYAEMVLLRWWRRDAVGSSTSSFTASGAAPSWGRWERRG